AWARASHGLHRDRLPRRRTPEIVRALVQTPRAFVWGGMKLFKRIATEMWLPALGALVWGLLVYSQQAQKNYIVALGAAASAFFLIFFFQGQLLRIKKNIRD